MQNILYLTEQLTDGGTAKHLAELLPRLREFDVQPHVWIRGQMGRYADILVRSGLPFMARKKLFPSLGAYVRRHEISLIHSYLHGAHARDAIYAKWLRIPYIKSTRNEGHWNNGSIRMRVNLRARRYFINHHLVNSHAVKRYLCLNENINPEKITVIQNGIVDISENVPSLKRSHLDLDLDDFVMISLCWLKPHKGLHFILQAMPEIRARIPKAKLVVIGSGPLEKELKDFVRDHRINVLFLGKITDPQSYLQLGDVLVAASMNEGLSNSVIEAQMMGLPAVITWEAGGNSEIIEHGVNGLLYNGTDASAFVNAIVNIANNNEALEVMKRKSRENYLRQFSIEKQVHRFLGYYMSVLHGQPQTSDRHAGTIREA